MYAYLRPRPVTGAIVMLIEVAAEGGFQAVAGEAAIARFQIEMGIE